MEFSVAKRKEIISENCMKNGWVQNIDKFARGKCSDKASCLPLGLSLLLFEKVMVLEHSQDNNKLPCAKRL